MADYGAASLLTVSPAMSSLLATLDALHPESKDEAERLFNGLSTGGKIEMPLHLDLRSLVFDLRSSENLGFL